MGGHRDGPLGTEIARIRDEVFESFQVAVGRELYGLQGRDISLGAISGGLEAAGVAKFKWPERLEIVAELPVTKMGKLDKKALRDMLAGRSTP